jgi:hypothetical protein
MQTYVQRLIQAYHRSREFYTLGQFSREREAIIERICIIRVQVPRSMKLLEPLELPNLHIVGDPCLLDKILFEHKKTLRKKLKISLDLSFGVHENKKSITFRHKLLSQLVTLERNRLAEIHFFTTWVVYNPWIESLLASYFNRTSILLV